MLLNPQKWSCLPQAIAYAIDMPFSDFIKSIGHDGSELVYSNKEFRRGFHIQECLDVLIANGIVAVPIEHHYALSPDGLETYTIGTLEEQSSRFERYLDSTARGFFEGISISQSKQMMLGHATAWIGKKIWDPRGYDERGEVYTYAERYHHNFTIQRLWRLIWV